MNKKAPPISPYRPYKHYTRLFIFSPAEPDYPVLQGYLQRCELNTFMTHDNPAITFMIHFLPGQFSIPKKSIQEFNFTDDNDCVIFLKNQDTTVIKRADNHV
jgi:hypothetical protein